jgi:hypothetical protein
LPKARFLAWLTSAQVGRLLSVVLVMLYVSTVWAGPLEILQKSCRVEELKRPFRLLGDDAVTESP